jgi:hypothetical protein
MSRRESGFKESGLRGELIRNIRDSTEAQSRETTRYTINSAYAIHFTISCAVGVGITGETTLTTNANVAKSTISIASFAYRFVME